MNRIETLKELEIILEIAVGTPLYIPITALYEKLKNSERKFKVYDWQLNENKGIWTETDIIGRIEAYIETDLMPDDEEYMLEEIKTWTIEDYIEELGNLEYEVEEVF